MAKSTEKKIEKKKKEVKKTAKKVTKKSDIKADKKSDKKSDKKADTKSSKKEVKKTAEKAPLKAAAKSTDKKSVKKSVEKEPKKTVKKSSDKAAVKPARDTAKKAEKKVTKKAKSKPEVKEEEQKDIINVINDAAEVQSPAEVNSDIVSEVNTDNINEENISDETENKDALNENDSDEDNNINDEQSEAEYESQYEKWKKTQYEKESQNVPLERLNKFIAANGIFSRRKIDEFILEGRVTVNGKEVFDLGTKINPLTDKVFIDGERVRVTDKKVYIMMNKPLNVITSVSDDKKRPTVIDIINTRIKIFPVGRLDFHTTGLLILTNDGDFTNKLMNPPFKIFKTYDVKLSRPLDQKHRLLLEKGIKLDGVYTLPAVINIPDARDTTQAVISISQGKNRQVRRMFEHFGYLVTKLHRSGYGNLKLGNLREGEFRNLTKEEIEGLLSKQREPKSDRADREERFDAPKKDFRGKDFKGKDFKKKGFKKDFNQKFDRNDNRNNFERDAENRKDFKNKFSRDRNDRNNRGDYKKNYSNDNRGGYTRDTDVRKDFQRKFDGNSSNRDDFNRGGKQGNFSKGGNKPFYEKRDFTKKFSDIPFESRNDRGNRKDFGKKFDRNNSNRNDFNKNNNKGGYSGDSRDFNKKFDRNDSNRNEFNRNDSHESQNSRAPRGKGSAKSTNKKFWKSDRDRNSSPGFKGKFNPNNRKRF